MMAAKALDFRVDPFNILYAIWLWLLEMAGIGEMVAAAAGGGGGGN
jgi:hypothetical protein